MLNNFFFFFLEMKNLGADKNSQDQDIHPDENGTYF